jgi:hypothetical protein
MDNNLRHHEMHALWDLRTNRRSAMIEADLPVSGTS